MDQKWTPSEPKMNTKWTPNGPQMDKSLIRNEPQINHKSTLHKPQINSLWTQSTVDPKFSQNGIKIKNGLKMDSK